MLPLLSIWKIHTGVLWQLALSRRIIRSVALPGQRADPTEEKRKVKTMVLAVALVLAPIAGAQAKKAHPASPVAPQPAPVYKGQTLGESLATFLATPQGRAANQPIDKHPEIYCFREEDAVLKTTSSAFFEFTSGELTDIYVLFVDEGSFQTAAFEMLDKLKAKFGKPTHAETGQLENGYGAQSTLEIISWTTPIYHIEFSMQTGEGSYKLEVMTPAYYAAKLSEAAAADKVKSNPKSID